MASRVKDLVEISGVGPQTEEESLAPSVLASFLLTYELGDTLTRVVERLASAESGVARNCLLVGSPGCGKSMLLSVAAELCEAKPTGPLHPRIATIRSALGAGRALAVRVRPGDGGGRLAS